ncbi:MAG TPA: ABC transporter permease [Gammaproteobacteria bacterium]|nr:ABC transporter permease [Gammaproteobacteria bacterium]
MASEPAASLPYRLTGHVGRRFVQAVEEFGYGAALLVESLYWIVAGHWLNQPVRLRVVAAEMVEIGVSAVPVVAILAFANGGMMALQGIYTLQDFGAESQVIPGIAMSVTREFGVLIAGIVVAGRSGSAIAARIGTMNMSQEIDALRVMGIEPVRYLVAPLLLAMLVMMPVLAILADAMAITGGGVIASLKLHIALPVYFDRALAELVPSDIGQGLAKSFVFGVLVAVVAAINGFTASGGAEGLGRATTRSVVLCIAAIVVADMIFTLFLSR